MKAFQKICILLVLVSIILTSCAAPATPPAPVKETVVVEKTTVVEKEVVKEGETVIVTATPEVQKPPDKITIWHPCGADTVANWDFDPVLQAVEKATNTDITIIAGQWGTDQINQYIASGTLPDIIGCQGPDVMPVIQTWIKDGVLAPFEGAVAEAAPNLLAEYEKNSTLNELKVDDKIYFQPIGWDDGLFPNMGLIHVRKDLLDKYGMEPPNTFDEYFEYLNTCKSKGDGKGVISGIGGGLGANLSAFLGAYNLPMRDFTKVGDHYEYFAVQPGVFDALMLFRELQARKLLAPESWEGVDAMEAYKTGKYCSLISNGGGHIGRIQNALEAVDKSFQNWMLPALTQDGTTRGYTQEPMFWGTAQVGGMKNNNPEAAARVINYLISEEGYQLTAVGIEGRDFEMKDGEPVLLPQRAKDGFPITSTDTGSHPLAACLVSWVPMKWQNWSLLYGHDQAWKDWYNKMMENQGKYQIPSYGSLIVTPLWADFLSTNNDLMNIAFTEIAKAPTKEAAQKRYDKFLEDWKASGGMEAQAEMSAKLVELYGK